MLADGGRIHGTMRLSNNQSNIKHSGKFTGCQRAPDENTVNTAYHRSEIWNFTRKIFEISREYAGATRPFVAAFNACKCCWNGIPPRRSLVYSSRALVYKIQISGLQDSGLSPQVLFGTSKYKFRSRILRYRYQVN